MNILARRKLKARLALGASGVATGIGLAFLVAILWTLLSRGLGGLSWQVFSQMTPAPGSDGGLLNAIYGSVVMTLLGVLIGAPIGILAATYLSEYGTTRATVGRHPFHQRCAAQCSFDRHRPVRLHTGGRADGAFLRHRRGDLTEHHRDPGRRAHARGHAATRAAEHAAGLGGPGRSALAHHHQYRLPGGAQRTAYRRAAGTGARLGGDRTAALHGARQSVLERQAQPADGEPAGGDLHLRHQPLSELAIPGLGGARC